MWISEQFLTFAGIQLLHCCGDRNTISVSPTVLVMAAPEPSNGKHPMKLAYATVESDHCSDDDFLESGQKPKMQEKAVKAAVTANRVLPEQLRGFFPTVAFYDSNY